MNKALEIYIHIPFCIKKCSYCDFLSFPAEEEIKDRYMEAICAELEGKSPEYKEYRIISVFIGGGTPSCVKPEWIARILKILNACYRVEEDAEITIEINPGTIDKRALDIYYEAGINRLSLGLQSVRCEELACLGRIHSYEQFLEAYSGARERGFMNINVDLMSGLPGQTTEDYSESLEKVTSLVPPPEHISAYSLIIEEGTPFFKEYEKGWLKLPDEDTEREMYEITRKVLQRAGYEQYEISNYAKPGYQCRHNIGYWLRRNYLGFGIGAASLVENVRFKNTDDLKEYIKDPLYAETNRQVLTKQEQMEETMFLGLRLTNGVSYSKFEQTFGCSMEIVYGEVIEKHVRQGLLYVTDNCETEEETAAYCPGRGLSSPGLDGREKYMRLTEKGLDVSNYVMADFLEPSLS